MKKTVLFLILSLVTIGCDNQEKAINSGYNDCDRTIVIDQSKVDGNWETANRIYYSKPQPSTTNSCTHSKIFIDATELEKAQIFASWLKENGTKICYKETSSYIECEHLITDPAVNDIIKKTKTLATLTLGEVEKKIIDLKGDFENYDQYMKISSNWLGKIEISLVTTYDPKGNNYSLPLIKRIIDNNRIGEKAKFIFKKVKINNKRSIIFGIEKDTEDYLYYDFSHIPPLVGKPVTSPL